MRMESAGKRVNAYCRKPVPRSGHVAVTYGNLMLVWGGYLDTPQFGTTDHFSIDDQYLDGKELWCYNIEAQIWDVWYTRSSPPGMSGCCAACVGNYLYLFGGFNANGNSNKLYRLDLRTKLWTQLVPDGRAPSPRDKTSCWAFEDKLVFFGGFGPSPVDDDGDETLSSRDQWHADPSSLWSGLPPRGWNNHLCTYSIIDNAWSRVPAKYNHPCPRAAHSTAVIGNRGFLFGGRFKNERMNDLHVLDLETMEWIDSCLPVGEDVPTGRSWHCMEAVSDRHLLLYGGYSTAGVPLNDVWVFDVENCTWHRQSSLPSETRVWHTAVRGMDAGEVIVFGGCCNDLLSHHEHSVHSNKVLSFFFSPKSLLRLCTEGIVRDIELLKDELRSLPAILRTKIKLHLPSNNNRHNYNLRSRPQSL